MNKASTYMLHTGRRIPVLGLGTWQLKKDTAGVVENAFALGYRLIDTSGDYGTQAGIGEAIKHSSLPREDLYIVTKVEETDDAYEAARRNIEELQLKYADLIVIHRPPPRGGGEELWRGLIRVKEEGFAKDIGVSNYSAELIDALIADSGEIPAVNQIEWSPFGYSEEMLGYAEGKRMLIQAYSPLTRTKRLDDETVGEIAFRYGKTPAQVLIRWSLQKAAIPIPKAGRKTHLEENLDIFDFDISGTDMRKLDSLNERYSTFGSLPY